MGFFIFSYLLYTYKYLVKVAGVILSIYSCNIYRPSWQRSVNPPMPFKWYEIAHYPD